MSSFTISHPPVCKCKRREREGGKEGERERERERGGGKEREGWEEERRGEDRGEECIKGLEERVREVVEGEKIHVNQNFHCSFPSCSVAPMATWLLR